ncbi:MAG: hypothetical protein HC828_15140 [Blastochloris sp.]|nr:hypothetical protein [Blastochloris sp.]
MELKPTCRVLAQYDIYVVSTTIDITQWQSGNQTYIGEGIAIEEIDTLLRMIDQQIAQQFNLSLE